MIIIDSKDQIFICKDCNEASATIDSLKTHGYEDKDITIILTHEETILERYTLNNPPKPLIWNEPREYNSDDFLPN